MMTIGHSNRPLHELIGMLQAHRVDLLVDVRTVPKSRYNPQFNTENLPAPLRQAGIEYLHMPGLGGLRNARKERRRDLKMRSKRTIRCLLLPIGALTLAAAQGAAQFIGPAVTSPPQPASASAARRGT